MTPERVGDKEMADPWLIQVAIGLLRAGRWLVAWALLPWSTVVIVLRWPVDSIDLTLIGITAVVLAAGAAYLALRIELDLSLFSRLASVDELPTALASLDLALSELGWLPASRVGRSLSARVDGVRRLVRIQSMLAIGQMLLLVLVLLRG